MATPFTDGIEEVTRAEHISPRKSGDNIQAKRVALYTWNPALGANGEWERVTSGGSSTSSSVTSVDDSASNTELLAANANRKEAVITNDSTSVLYVSFGEAATTTNYTARLEQYGYVQTDYKGQINGIWASNSTGAARITELT